MHRTRLGALIRGLMGAMLAVCISCGTVVDCSHALASTDGTSYGPERVVSGDWIIDHETVTVAAQQPVYFVQNYHEQHKIVVQDGGVLRISGSYIRSDFRFPIELHDTSRLEVENSNLAVQDGKGAVVTNLDNSVVEASDSQLDFVGIANGDRPISHTTVSLCRCTIGQLELDLSGVEGVVIEGLTTGNIEEGPCHLLGSP